MLGNAAAVRLAAAACCVAAVASGCKDAPKVGPSPPAPERAPAEGAPVPPAAGRNAVPVTVRGSLVDVGCYLKEGAKALEPEHTACSVRCIKAGSPIALVEDGTARMLVATVAPGRSLHELLLPHVGMKVQVSGKAVERGGTAFIEVEDVKMEHAHHAAQGGSVGMFGDIHLEAVVMRTGEVRLYFSDAFREPLPADTGSGVAEVRIGEKSPAMLPLAAGPGGKFLRARIPDFPRAVKAVEVTPHLQMRGKHEMMTFLVDVVDEAPARKPKRP